MKHFCETMKTASVRDIRQNFPAVMRWIEEGENVAITMRRKVVARLIPERAPVARNAPARPFYRPGLRPAADATLQASRQHGAGRRLARRGFVKRTGASFYL